MHCSNDGKCGSIESQSVRCGTGVVKRVADVDGDVFCNSDRRRSAGRRAAGCTLIFVLWADVRVVAALLVRACNDELLTDERCC